MAQGRDIKRISKAIYETPAELELRIKERMEQAMSLAPNSPQHRRIMQEIAKLRIYADAKLWLAGPKTKAS